MKTVQIFLYRFVMAPDQMHYEIELRSEGFNSKGNITKEMYWHLKGAEDEKEFPQGFYVLIEDVDK